MSDARRGDPREYDARDPGNEWPRVYDPRDRDEHDPRDGLMHDLDLPRGDQRELVVDRDRIYELDGEDSRALAAVGAFRIVPEHDLDLPNDTLENLRDQWLVELVDLGATERGLTLTIEVRTRSHGRRRVVYYGCRNHRRCGADVCSNSLELSMDTADAALLEVIEDDLLDASVVSDIVAGVVAELAPEPSRRPRAAAIFSETSAALILSFDVSLRRSPAAASSTRWCGPSKTARISATRSPVNYDSWTNTRRPQPTETS